MIEIKTQEQLIELAARSVYLLSSSRYWQKDYENDPSPEVKKFVERDKERIDEFLKQVGLVEFKPLKEVMEQISKSISINNESNDSVISSTDGDS